MVIFPFSKEEAPALAEAFLVAVFIIWDWAERIRQLDVFCFLSVEWFWGLTCDFGWKNAKK
jgi:hypothetical protein